MICPIERLRETVRSWNTYEVSRSAPVNMEISPKGVARSTGAEALPPSRNRHEPNNGNR